MSRLTRHRSRVTYVVNLDTPAPYDVARHRRHLEPLTRLWSWFADASGLAIDGRVGDSLADELTGGGVGCGCRRALHLTPCFEARCRFSSHLVAVKAIELRLAKKS